MALEYQNSEIEREALAFEIHKKISDFVISNSNKLETIAQMLGATNFLKVIDIGKGKAPVTSLDISGFVKNLKNTNQLHNLRLPDQIEQTHKTILPPDEGEIKPGDGNTGIEKKRFFSRTRYIMEILADLKLDFQTESGTNLPSMMRSISYIAFTIPEINTLLLVNDEEGNATFIVYNIDNTEENNRDHFINLTKNQLKNLGSEKVSRVEFDKSTEDWKKEIAELLVFGPKTNKKETKKQIHTEINRPREKAPNNWKNRNTLVTFLGRGPETIEKIMLNYRESNPEWFKNYDDPVGKLVEYYSPELTTIIAQELSKRTKAPNDWKTKTGLGSILKKDGDTIKKIAEQYRKSNPEWFYMYDDEIGKIVEHYSPELVKIIIEKIESKKAKDKWNNCSNLGNILNRSPKIIKKYADEYRESHPEWFDIFEDAGGKMVEFYSGELIEIITKNINERTKPSEGWKHRYDLTKILKRSSNAINTAVKKYRNSNPEWFKMHDNTNGELSEYFSPELIKNITQEFSQRTKAPENWKTNKKLSTILNINEITVKRFTDKYRESNPEWFQVYEPDAGEPTEHYSPELIDLLNKEFNNRLPAPDNWKTNKSIATLLNLDTYYIKKIAEQYRDTHPEWFKEYGATDGKLRKHYSPELTKIIIEHFNK